MHTPERLIVERGSRTGQPIIVSIDSTRLGPALGGCRIKTYPTWADGVADAVRLSAAMTEKAALAGLDHGGGKTVVALTGPPGDRSHLLADIADVIDSLRGAYLTGPDVGSSPADMEEIGRRTKYVLCRPEPAGSGDSSGPTALGVTVSLEAVCEHLWPGRDLSSVSFSILGLGHVGARVGAHLAGRGARLVVSDADPQRRALAEARGRPVD
ncbi:Glu/Leu/Phe/Val dehydrogenase dimerization domain-containing protein [Actinoplanes sp. NPDC051633]|uniref:Glu/Leu/Phe/Val dehydrogenase dimerization domain-containing protein n=1 Tax=Actinoplanes sp. NPDC051633 TaxID=3155670 RepID=UPI003435A019